MIQTVDGIILRTMKYKESSVIADVLTEQYGLRSYLMNGVRKAKKSKSSFFEPMNIVELEVYHKEQNSLNRIKEIRLAEVYVSLPYKVVKSGMAQFMSEITLQLLRLGAEGDGWFGLLKETLLLLDQSESRFGNCHLLFLVSVLKELGLSPQKAAARDTYFNIRSGCCEAIGGSVWHKDEQLSSLFMQLNSLPFAELMQLSISVADKQALIELFLSYLSAQVENFQYPKSYEILKTVLG